MSTEDLNDIGLYGLSIMGQNFALVSCLISVVNSVVIILSVVSVT